MPVQRRPSSRRCWAWAPVSTFRFGRRLRRAQERLGRGPADAAPLGHLEIAAALVVAAVEIVGLRDAALLGGVAERVEDLPRHPRRLDPPFAAGAVELVRTLPVVLRPLEQRQHVVPGPAGIAELAPVIVVRRLAAHVDHAVDGRAAAQHLAARIAQRAPVQSRARAPSSGTSRCADCPSCRDSRRGYGSSDSCRCRPPPAAGPGCRIGGKPVGQDAAGRAGARPRHSRTRRTVSAIALPAHIVAGREPLWSAPGCQVDGGVAG